MYIEIYECLHWELRPGSQRFFQQRLVQGDFVEGLAFGVHLVRCTEQRFQICVADLSWFWERAFLEIVADGLGYAC